MLRDVFYYGAKPNAHPREQHAKNLADARNKCTTDHFWIINEFCDYRNFDWDFDFDFLPDKDVWAEDHINVWPSQHQKDSGTWLCANKVSEITIYRTDVNPLIRKNEINDNWKLLEKVDTARWDFSWHPDPTDPPYIYRWGCKFFPVEIKACIEYHVDGAKNIKYMKDIVPLLPDYDCIKEYDKVDHTKFDMSWRPNPIEPPFIYVWGNKHVSGELRPTLEYHTPGATQKKYMGYNVPVLPEWDRWNLIENVDKTKFDFSWRPDPREPDFIYVFGNDQHDGTIMPTLEYHVPGATIKKYVTDIKAKLLPNPSKFTHLENSCGIDYSWVPDPTSPPYIYAWGNQWNKPEDKISIQYVVEGATEYKYMSERATRKPCLDNWIIPKNLDVSEFDFSWEPSPADPPYIYEFGTQWQKTGGPKYIVEGATEVKYIDLQKAKSLPDKSKWKIPNHVDTTNFDFSWHPDNTSPPYIYHFATQWALSGGPTYNVDGATEVKYMEEPYAVALPNRENWEIPNDINIDKFDFSWHPYVEDQPYIYQFGTQHQKTGGPRYITPGVIPSSPIKYIDTRILRAIKYENKSNFLILNNYKIKNFDWSWHPDETEEPYIYVFGNNQYPAEIMPTIEYAVQGATKIKYINNVVATLDIDLTNWEIPNDVDTTNFDFSWKPNPTDPPYMYQFGTQHQKTGGPRYIVHGATEVKYVSHMKATKLPDKSKFSILDNLLIENFDYSWHHDDTDEPYIYVFGNNLYPGNIMPTLEYQVQGAKKIKFVDSIIATLAIDKTNWEIPNNVDTEGFDFSWKPNPKDPPYIYQFRTQHQKTGGPRYIVPGAIDIKYMNHIVKALPQRDKFRIIDNLKIREFDYSWHPDNTDEPYIYVFGNNQYPAEVMPTIEYVVDGATEVKYINNIIAILDEDKTNWEIPNNIDITNFDFSWKPNPKDPPYIYEFGTQWQKTGGPRYIIEDATEVKYIETQKVRALPNKSKWIIPNHVDTTNFDFSWHPDSTSPPYIYHFATQWALSGGPTYKVQGATEVKYMEEPCAVALPNKENWEIPDDIDAESFDFSWHPYVEDQPYIYQFGTQHQKTGGPTYVTPGAIETSPIKYIDTRILKAKKLNTRKNFSILNNYKIKNFDWSWHPDDTDDPYIYVFGNNQYPAEIMPTIEYVVPGAKEIKYINEVAAILSEDRTNWVITQQIDESKFDFSWKPNPKDPPYIYRWGNKFISNLYKATIEYIVPGAVDVKYMSNDVEVVPEWEHWEIPNNLDTTNFDFTWRPDPLEPDFVWEFGTQHQKTGGPKYIVQGATETKYVSTQQVKILPNKTNFKISPDCVLDLSDFDFSWHPDSSDPPYIYAWGNQWNKAEDKVVLTYTVSGATEFKYMTDVVKSLPNRKNWVIPVDVDVKDFDFSWEPNPHDDPFVYQFGTQWQKTGGPRYVISGLEDSPVKYVDVSKAKKLPNRNNFIILNDYKVKDFDWSWHPDETEEPYIYVFGNNQYPAEIMPTIEYVVQGATQIKYVNDIIATLDVDMNNWDIPDYLDVDGFDFSWKPNPKDPPYMYEFGTQHQKTGGPRYIIHGAIETKYIETQKVKALPNRNNWELPKNIDVKDFDFSWHPDSTSPPYIYHFATQWALSGGPIYRVVGATESKYMEEPCAVALPNKENWEVPDDIDAESFDFSWHPYIEDQPYIYQFGTQWQKTGGPRYITPGVIPTSPIKYIDTRILKAKKLHNKKNFAVLNNYKIKDFDYSWHPDETEEPYIYVFGNNLYPAEIMPTIEYVVQGAKEIKYVHDVVATLDVDMSNWDVPNNVDTEGFDFSWKPNPKDPPYIYEFGTQWQKTGGPRYVIHGAVETKYIDIQKVKALPDRSKWELPKNIDVTDFDFSWHPDSTSPPYIYHFATQWALSGGPIYRIEGATEVKYMEEPYAVALPNKENWEVPNDVDAESFDFSWHPYVEDQPYIYQFGTQWQKTGGPRYITPGVIPSSPIKYIDTRILKAKKLFNKNNFSILNNYKVKDFDWSWHPDETEEPYIYVFGNNQYPAEIMPTIEYVVPGAKEIKYVHDVVAILGEDKNNWVIPSNLDVTDFDFSWKPNPKDPPFIYQFGTQWQKTGGPKYVIPGATEIKYISSTKAKALPTTEYWEIPEKIDISGFDFSWHPDDTDPAYIYKFSTQWAITGGPIYRVPGATEIKYVDSPTAIALPDITNWVVPKDIDSKSFDFSWHPYSEDEPFIYEFGTQWQKTGGPKYVTPGTTGVSATKYIDTRILKSKRLPNMSNWVIPKDVTIVDFDYSWHPDATDSLFVYEFGTQWHDVGGPMYVPPGAKIGSTPVKYIDTNINKAILGPNKKHWEISNNISVKNFDFSWVPHPNDPPYIYQFGTQHQKTGGPRYIVSGAKDVKFIDHPNVKGIRLTSQENWSNPNNSDVSTFDFSWHPDDTSPPYIYQFGTVLDRDDGPRYTSPNYIGEIVYLPRIEKQEEFIDEDENVIEETKPEESIELIKVKQYYIETTLDDLVQQHSNEVFWALNKNIDYTNFDFEWRPEIINVEWESEYVHVFGSTDSVATQTYFVNAKSYLQGYKDLKFIQNIKLNESTLSELFIKPDMFFVDKGNKESQDRFNILKLKYNNIQKTRFLNSWVDTINRCINRSTTELCWIMNSELDYTNFDFNYYPNPWQMKMVHVFGTQWNHWGTTFLINRETFPRDTKYIKIIEHLNNLNFVKDRIALASSITYDIFYINHGNLSESELTRLTDSDHIVDYENDYLTTFKKILSQLPEKKDHYIWIANTICDYSNFDFTYICDPFARDQLHVFPSDKQKFGDTFFVNVNKLREYIDAMNTLKDYKDINYNQTQRVKRLPAPTIVTAYDSHVLSVMEEFNFPYATFITEDNKQIDIREDEPISLWDAESKTILITSTGGTRIVVPKEVKNYVETQLYDYPYIKTSTRLAKSNPLDIVFLSNGEKCADANYEHLLKVTKGLPNKITRVDGVNGRVAAYQSAAKASNTPWFFTVFAKLKINTKFDFNWQPDRLQIPKHYMFLAKNPVNGLIYGHQGLIAYNSQMVLNNFGEGLDFTLDSPHETIELLSGTATFNTDEFSTWRTAFREVIKLKNENSEISNKRLDIWLTKAEGDFAEYSLLGAKDGISFYKKCKGNLDLLRQSYEWKWLQEFYNKKHKKK